MRSGFGMPFALSMAMNHRDAEAFIRAERRRRRAEERGDAGNAIVSIPGRELRSIEATIESHRRILRMATDEKRRWIRMEPTAPKGGRRASGSEVLPIGDYLIGAVGPEAASL